MKRKQLLLLLFSWLMTPLGIEAAGPVQFFCIELHNGSKAEFALSTQPLISFSNGSMTVTTTEKTITADLSDVISYTFSEESISTSISTPTMQHDKLLYRTYSPKRTQRKSYCKYRGSKRSTNI